MPSSSGCSLCNVRMQTMPCTRLLAVQPHIKCRVEAPLQSTDQLSGWHRSSRGRGGGVQVQCVQALERPSKESRAVSRDDIRPPQREIPDSSIKTEDLILPQFDRALGSVELIVAGAGPSGLAVAERVSQAGVVQHMSCQTYWSRLVPAHRVPTMVQTGAGLWPITMLSLCSPFAGFRVCVIDPAPLAHWPNNYGEPSSSPIHDARNGGPSQQGGVQACPTLIGDV